MLSPLRVGLTGGIGSGKSTVAKVFEVLSIPVYYADEASKRIMHSDAELVSRIKKQFGGKTLTRPVNLTGHGWLKRFFNDTYQLDLLKRDRSSCHDTRMPIPGWQCNNPLT